MATGNMDKKFGEVWLHSFRVKTDTQTDIPITMLYNQCKVISITTLVNIY